MRRTETLTANWLIGRAAGEATTSAGATLSLRPAIPLIPVTPSLRAVSEDWLWALVRHLPYVGNETVAALRLPPVWVVTPRVKAGYFSRADDGKEIICLHSNNLPWR